MTSPAANIMPEITQRPRSDGAGSRLHRRQVSGAKMRIEPSYTMTTGPSHSSSEPLSSTDAIQPPLCPLVCGIPDLCRHSPCQQVFVKALLRRLYRGTGQRDRRVVCQRVMQHPSGASGTPFIALAHSALSGASSGLMVSVIALILADRKEQRPCRRRWSPNRVHRLPRVTAPDLRGRHHDGGHCVQPAVQHRQAGRSVGAVI